MDGRSFKDGSVERKTMRLTLRWMFETAIGDGANELRLQQEVIKSSRVNADITAFSCSTASANSEVAFLLCCSTVGSLRSGSSGGGLIGGKLFVRVVDEVFLVRHGDGRIVQVAR